MFQRLVRPVSGILFAAGSEDMMREQYKSLTRLVPFLYIVCLTACVAIMTAFASGAPHWLSLYIPGGLGLVMVLRYLYWVKRRGTEATASLDAIRKDMRGTEILGPALAFGYSCYAVLMMSYAGNPFQQSLLVITVWITAIASAFCLAVLPMASILVVIGAAGPLITAFVLSGNFQMIILSGLFAIISGMMIYMLHNNFATFAEILASRSQLIEKQKQTEAAHQALNEMAYTDALTGLANRRAFERQLAEHVAHADPNTTLFTVGMIDLDGFKPINDVYGHVVGDEVLVQAGARIRRAMEGTGFVARMGGDEFAVLVDRFATPGEIGALALKLKTAFFEPIRVGSISARLSCSCGFSIYPASGEQASRLIDRADMALYRAKAMERGGYAIFDVAFESAACERANIEQALRDAIAGDTLTVHFQPLIDLSTATLTGFEALARWDHPKLGQISPGVFVPIAEQAGLVEEMTARLLKKAARMAARWPAALTLSFNLSAYQLDKPGAAERILSTLNECGLPPSRFEAEITETAILKNISASRKTIETLKAAGARISLDDFGTGFSSLSHVKDLPLDKIKIDKSFVDRITTDERIGNIVRSIINMCEFLDLTCVAEGIEKAEQLDFLKQNNCTGGQGYLFSRPIPNDRVTRLLDELATRRKAAEAAKAAAQPTVKAA